jgi:hypothetical protein
MRSTMKVDFRLILFLLLSSLETVEPQGTCTSKDGSPPFHLHSPRIQKEISESLAILYAEFAAETHALSAVWHQNCVNLMIGIADPP